MYVPNFQFTKYLLDL